MTQEQALEKLNALEKKKAAYAHAMGLISYDAVTGAPLGGAACRGETLAVLSQEEYRLKAGPETQELLAFLAGCGQALPPQAARRVEILRQELDETRCIPPEEYAAYQKLLNDAEAVWHEAKGKSDFDSFAPYLKKIIDTQIRFAAYSAADKDPYEYYLDRYEPGMDVKALDAFFSALRERLVPLLQRVQAAKQVDASFLTGDFPLEKQRALAQELMDVLRIDRAHCAIGETEHPFTTDFSKFDVRITTHYYRQNLFPALFSVVHEGGHALYELNTADEYAYTCLGTGVSMGVHESQSRFYENLIGRSRGFIAFLTPRLQALFPQLSDVSQQALYRAVNRCEASLIRIEADELTYCLHVMVRYELEKKLFARQMAVEELPQAWNALYREYLGVVPSCDREGVLQDSHWAGGSFGYFPSYALGSAYGAQMMHCMKKSVDVDACAAAGDLAPVNRWLCENIWRHGKRYRPDELLVRVFGGPFDPAYYLAYLEKKYTEIYEL